MLISSREGRAATEAYLLANRASRRTQECSNMSIRNYSPDRIATMNTSPRSTTRKSPSKGTAEAPAYDPRSLAYEDVVSLASRLAQRGYGELGQEFLTFANSPTGLASFYHPATKGRKGRAASHQFPEQLAAIPYVVAATMLLNSNTLQREAVGQAVLLIELGKAHLKVQQEEEEPPMFLD
jgi:hypothetical protein